MNLIMVFDDKFNVADIERKLNNLKNYITSKCPDVIQDLKVYINSTNEDISLEYLKDQFRNISVDKCYIWVNYSSDKIIYFINRRTNIISGLSCMERPFEETTFDTCWDGSIFSRNLNTE